MFDASCSICRKSIPWQDIRDNKVEIKSNTEVTCKECSQDGNSDDIDCIDMNEASSLVIYGTGTMGPDD